MSVSAKRWLFGVVGVFGVFSVLICGAMAYQFWFAVDMGTEMVGMQQRHQFQACIQDPEGHGWEDPQECADELNGVIRDQLDRQDRRRLKDDDAAAGTSVPFNQEIPQEIQLVHLRNATLGDPSRDGHRQAADELVRIGQEIADDGFKPSRIVQLLFKFGAFEQALQLSPHIYDSMRPRASRAALLMTDQPQWEQLAQVPTEASGGQLKIAMAQCLTGQKEGATQRLEALANAEDDDSLPSLMMIEVVTMACDIPFEELGVEPPANSDDTDAIRAFNLLGAFAQDSEAKRRALDSLSPAHDAQRLALSAAIINDDTLSRHDIADMLGSITDRQQRSTFPYFADHFLRGCPDISEETHWPMLIPDELVDAAGRLDRLANQATDDDLIEARVTNYSSPSTASFSDTEITYAQAFEWMAKALRMEAVQHQILRGDFDAARQILDDLGESEDMVFQPCLMATREAVGDFDGALEIHETLYDEDDASISDYFVPKLRLFWQQERLDDAFALAESTWPNIQELIADGRGNSFRVSEYMWLWTAVALESERLDELRAHIDGDLQSLGRLGGSLAKVLDIAQTPEDQRHSLRAPNERDTFPPTRSFDLRSGPDGVVGMYILGYLAGDDGLGPWWRSADPSIYSISGYRSRARADVARRLGDDAEADYWQEHADRLGSLLSDYRQSWLLGQF